MIARNNRLFVIFVGLSVYAFVLTVAAQQASAFQIQSGFSDGCHELMTVDAARESMVSMSMAAEDVPIPRSGTYDAVAAAILEELDVEWESEREKFVLVSFALGARWPDTHGHPLTDSVAMRETHSESAVAAEHALRQNAHDFEKGNAQAVAAAQTEIVERLERVEAFLAAPPDEQLVRREVVLDYYGPVTMELWGPAFHLGHAAHTVQDSFSHTIRTEDLRRILHVMNFVEASRGEHDDERDGIPHSSAMDRCFSDGASVAAGSFEATRDFFDAFHEREFEGDVDAVDDFFAEWMTYEPGCTLENDFCDSPWLEVARLEPSQPILRRALACNTTSSARSFALWAMVLAVLALIYRRRRPIRPRRERA